MHFGFALELSDIDLRNIDLLDTHLDLLDTDIPSKNFCLHSVFKASSRHVFKMSSGHVFKTSSRHNFNTSSRYVFKTSSRHVFNTSSRRLQDVLKMSSRHNLKTSSRPTNVCWIISWFVETSFNSLQSGVAYLYPLKTSENLFFRG